MRAVTNAFRFYARALRRRGHFTRYFTVNRRAKGSSIRSAKRNAIISYYRRTATSVPIFEQAPGAASVTRSSSLLARNENVGSKKKEKARDATCVTFGAAEI